MMRNTFGVAATASLGVALAATIGFALANSQGTFGTGDRTSVASQQIRSLQAQATSLDRPRGPSDELPPKLEEMLAGLPDQVPDAAERSMRVLSAAGVGDVYVAPSATGFAILSTIGFAGTVPGGLSDANPVVGGTAALPDGRLALLAIASDEVSDVHVRLRGTQYLASRIGNGVWWVAPSGSLDPDDLAVSARMVDGTVVRIF